MKNDWRSSTVLFNTPILLGDNRVPGLKLPKEIQDIIPTIFKAATDLGLDYFPNIIEWLTYSDISEIAAYGGFPQRYPHWRFGMEYEELSKGFEYGMSRIFEMIINCLPAVTYLLDSNSFTDNVTVIGHALGHNDFFKNNIWFNPTDKNMLEGFANNRSRIMQIMARWGEEKVEAFIDDCLTIDSLIDIASAWDKREHEDPVRLDKREYEFPRRFNVPEGHDYMEKWINTKEWNDEEWERIRKEELRKSLGIVKMFEKDIMKFLIEHAPLKPWEQSVMSMLYDEAMYFAPQGMTKVCNEGHACLSRDMYVMTDSGIITIGELVENKFSGKVSGDKNVTNWFKHKDHECIKVKTKRGFELEGSVTHKVMLSDDSWCSLDGLKVGYKIKLALGDDLWSKDYIKLQWQPKEIGLNLDTARRKVENTRSNNKIKLALEKCEASIVDGVAQYGRGKNIKLPEIIDEDFAAFLGYLTGDGHVCVSTRHIGLTTGDEDQADNFIELVNKLFGLECSKRWDDSFLNGRWRVNFSSKQVESLLIYLGIPTGVSSETKKIPNCILRSPKSVMTAFLRAYFDCDVGGYDYAGIVLSTSSVKMVSMIQNVLLNYGILSLSYLKDKDNWHITISGKSAAVFLKEIGFGLARKQKGLEDYVNDKKWFLKEDLDDEIVSIELTGKHVVYDLTVEDTHRYSAQGFINHNSYVDFNLMARIGMPRCSIVTYAKHKSEVLGGKYSINPYKLGFELLMDIEERWNKGRFGREYEECKDSQKKENWDLQLGLGKEKVFEVRKNYNDVTLLLEFFTEEFCRKHDFFTWGKFPGSEHGVEAEYKITGHDWKKARDLLVKRHMNRGLPEIKLVECDGKGRGILVLQHSWDGRVLHQNHTDETMRCLARIWKKPVALLTKNKNGKDQIFYAEYGGNVKELRRGEWLAM